MTAKKLTRRRYSTEFKAQVLAECSRPGASIAAVAIAHGINPNIVHNWRHAGKKHNGQASLAAAPTFIPLPVPSAADVSRADIRVELRSGSVTATILWPISASAECAQFLRKTLA